MNVPEKSYVPFCFFQKKGRYNMKSINRRKFLKTGLAASALGFGHVQYSQGRAITEQ